MLLISWRILEKDICGSNFLEPGPKLFSTGDVADLVGDLGEGICLFPTLWSKDLDPSLLDDVAEMFEDLGEGNFCVRHLETSTVHLTEGCLGSAKGFWRWRCLFPCSLLYQGPSNYWRMLLICLRILIKEMFIFDSLNPEYMLFLLYWKMLLIWWRIS